MTTSSRSRPPSRGAGRPGRLVVDDEPPEVVAVAAPDSLTPVDAHEAPRLTASVSGGGAAGV